MLLHFTRSSRRLANRRNLNRSLKEDDANTLSEGQMHPVGGGVSLKTEDVSAVLVSHSQDSRGSQSVEGNEQEEMMLENAEEQCDLPAAAAEPSFTQCSFYIFNFASDDSYKHKCIPLLSPTDWLTLLYLFFFFFGS